jgi:hypothetical protein
MKYQAASIPEWFSKGSVYQINPRTFSSEGTIKAVTEQLPFLADLGFSIMYLCPIFSEDDSTDKKNETWNYNEKDAAASGVLVEAGHTLIDHLFSK